MSPVWNLNAVYLNKVGDISPSGITAYAKAYMTSDSTVNDSTSFVQKSVLDSSSAITDKVTVDSDYFTVQEDGIYVCYFNCYFFNNTDLRTNVGVSWEINGTLQDEVSASNYIRVTSGHDEATTSMMTIYDLTSGDQLGLRFAEVGYTGPVELIGSKSLAYVRKIK